MSRRVASTLVALTALATTALAHAGEADEFEYLPPGNLIPGSGQGRADETVYAPGMRFPIESAPALTS